LLWSSLGREMANSHNPGGGQWGSKQREKAFALVACPQ
jgi:hypothetical protein